MVAIAGDPIYRDYIAGKLGLAGLDLSTPLHIWLDAIYATWADAPHEVLEKALKQTIIQEARIDPERARETWGLRPEHQATSRGLGQRGGLGEADKVPPRLPSGAAGNQPPGR